MWSMLVRSFSLGRPIIFFERVLYLTPAFSTFIPEGSLSLPMATIIVSTVIVFCFPLTSSSIYFFPSSKSYTLFTFVWVWVMTPSSSSYSTIFVAISWSIERKKVDLLSRCTFFPNPAKKPAHSTAMYPPPTISVVPGSVVMLNRSSLVTASSAGMPGYCLGLPPAAIKKFLPFTLYEVVSFSKIPLN